jgi:hypothetical protein
MHDPDLIDLIDAWRPATVTTTDNKHAHSHIKKKPINTRSMFFNIFLIFFFFVLCMSYALFMVLGLEIYNSMYLFVYTICCLKSICSCAQKKQVSVLIYL